MDCVIRKARWEDDKSVIEIMRQVQQMHVAWRPDIYRPNEAMIPADEYRRMMDGDTLYAAEMDARVVGVMALTFRHIENPTHVTRDIVFIDTMAVDEKYRGMGVGHLFFEKVQEIKKEKNLDGIELQVNAKNRAAYEMFTYYGFTEKSINMELL